MYVCMFVCLSVTKDNQIDSLNSLANVQVSYHYLGQLEEPNNMVTMGTLQGYKRMSFICFRVKINGLTKDNQIKFNEFISEFIYQKDKMNRNSKTD